MRLFIVLLLFFCCLQVSGQEKLNLDYKKHLNKPADLPQIPTVGNMVLVILMVVVGIIGVLVVIKKIWFPLGNLPEGKRLALRETVYLGNKTFLHAVQAGDKLLVIGVSPHNISNITELELEITNEDKEPPKTNSFSTIFSSALSASKKKSSEILLEVDNTEPVELEKRLESD